MNIFKKEKTIKIGTVLKEDFYLKIKTLCQKNNIKINKAVEFGLDQFIKHFEKNSINLQESSNKIQRASIDPMRLVELWNEHCIPKGYKRCHGLGAGIHLKNFLESLKYLPTEKDWIDLFDTMFKSKFLKGENEKGWRPGLIWIVNFDNAIKVKNGDFNDANTEKREEHRKMMRLKHDGVKDD